MSDLLDAGCLHTAPVSTEKIDEWAGCTPGEQALGVAALDLSVSDVEAVDVFVWIAADVAAQELFHSDATLGLFAEKCEGAPLTGCNYQSWLVAAGISASDPMFLHVQTEASAQPQVSYQVMEPGTWRWELPANEALICPPLHDPGPHLSLDLVTSQTWNNSWRALDLSRMPPALDGPEWICTDNAGGWRQAGYLLRNQGDTHRHLTRIQLRHSVDDGGPLTTQPVAFHFAILRCRKQGDGAVVEYDQEPLAISCDDSTVLSSKEMDVTIVLWEGTTVPESQYVLVLQVPPEVGTSLDIRLESADLAKNIEPPHVGM